MLNIMNMVQITKWVLYLINFNLSFRVFVGASDVLDAKERNRYVENRKL